MADAAAIPETWRDWLLHNRDRGCDRDGLIERAMQQGFDRQEIEAVLASSQPSSFPRDASTIDAPSWLQWFQAPLTRPEHQPRAWRLDTPLAQLYDIPDLLSVSECKDVIEAINGSLQPSTVTRGSRDYRTSRTCHLRQNSPDLAARPDQRFADLVGVDPRLSEPIQGQRYDPGEYFKEHTDWFSPHEGIHRAHPTGRPENLDGDDLPQRRRARWRNLLQASGPLFHPDRRYRGLEQPPAGWNAESLHAARGDAGGAGPQMGDHQVVPLPAWS